MKVIYSSFLVLVFFFCHAAGFSEGTKQIRPTSSSDGALQTDVSRSDFALPGCQPNHRLNIHISNPGEKILFGFSSTPFGGNYTLKNPSGTTVLSGSLPTSGSTGFISTYNKAIIGPFPSNGGYTPIEYEIKPSDETGDYFIELPDAKGWEFWDFQVVSGANNPPLLADALNGRVWSSGWQFSASGSTFSGNIYIYSDDGIVTSCKFDQAYVGWFTIYCNQFGCTNTGDFTQDRKSIDENTGLPSSPHYFPEIAQYKVFLNNPDISVYPNGTYGEIIGLPGLDVDPAYGVCDPHKIISINVNKTGNIKIIIDVPYGDPTYDKSIETYVLNGSNDIDWDGTDGHGGIVPDGTQIIIQVDYQNGLTNLPIWDQESNPNGYLVTLIRPPVSPTFQIPKVYWFDSELCSPNCPPCPSGDNLDGCTPAPFATPPVKCHTWFGSYPNLCHDKMINTWWYSASSSSNPVYVFQTGTPPIPSATTPLFKCNPGTFDITATVLPNEEVRWYDQPTGGTLLYTGSTFNISLPNLGSYSFYAEAYNPATTCVSTSRKLVTVNVVPAPLAPSQQGGPFFHCGLGIVTLHTSNIDPNIRIDWYDNSTGGVLLGTGNSFTTASLSATTNFYAESVDITVPGGCSSPSRTLIIAEIRDIPTLINSTPLPICSKQQFSVVLQSNVITADFTWTASCNPALSITGFTATQSTPVQNINDILTNITSSDAVVIYHITPQANSCTGSPVNYSITVHPLPVPTMAGDNHVCVWTPNHIYSTEIGKNNYSWQVIGGNITSGGTNIDHTATVTWNSTGSKKISINYKEPLTGCTAASSSELNVDVKDLPVPEIFGATAVCKDHSADYNTQGGMTNYMWTVDGGTITSGGTSTDNTVTITWNTLGSQSVSVNYTNTDDCTATSPSDYNVEVQLLPYPTISSASGTNMACVTNEVIYTTQSGQSFYTWAVQPILGRTILSGGGTADDFIKIRWDNNGPFDISINFEDGSGCTAPTPTIYDVTVNPTPSLSVSGLNEICAGSDNVNYNTASGMIAYSWTISSGGTFIGGTSSNSVKVKWDRNATVNQWIKVNYKNSLGCSNSTEYPVTVHPLPVSIFSGNLTACQLHPDAYLYTANSGPPCSYTWSITPDNSYGSISNNNVSPASITWNTPGTTNLRLDAITGFGCSTNASQQIQINPRPIVSITPCFDTETNRSAKRFTLKGGTPLLIGSPPQGLYIITPPPAADVFYYSDVDGKYYFEPSKVPGTGVINYHISYKYTNQFNCPATTNSIPLTVRPQNTPCGSSITDYRFDNTTYPTAVLEDGKCWMLKNLRYGQSPPASTPQTDNCIVERNCLTSDPTCANYGGLYQWDELIQYGITAGPAYQGVCPPGWHIPSSLEWQGLIDAVADLGPGIHGDGLAGSFLKDERDRFNALLDGIYYMDNTEAFIFGNTTTATMFWTSTIDDLDPTESRAIARGLNNWNYGVSRYPASKANAFPVRCVKD